MSISPAPSHSNWTGSRPPAVENDTDSQPRFSAAEKGKQTAKLDVPVPTEDELDVPIPTEDEYHRSLTPTEYLAKVSSFFY